MAVGNSSTRTPTSSLFLVSLAVGLVPLACTATVSRPADADPGDVESAPAAPGTPCEGLDESTCTQTAGCALGRGVEILQTPRGPCRGEYKFAGCQTEDTSGVELPASAAACGPNGQEFYFGRVQDTPDGWDQHRCTRPLVDFDAAPLCPGTEVPAPTAEEQAFATRQHAGEAISAYVAALDALRLGNTSQYLDAFAEDMTCFYGATKDAKRRLVRARRKGAASPTPGNACNVCPDDAWCELQACLHIKPLPG